MMPPTLRYFASLQSPWTYLGHDRLYEITRRRGAAVIFKPVDFGKIFSLSGGLPLPQRAPQRQAYRLVDLARWRDHLGIELNLHPKFFPAAELTAARMVTALGLRGGDAGVLAGAVLRAVWVGQKDIGDDAVLRDLAGDCGLDGADLLAAANQAETVAAHEANTEEAIEIGVFGAPTYELDGELFWGQDRLDLLDRALEMRAG
jgi:carboxymethylenebutenolidase